jgi:class 3 adenylate cyclase/streptogramin lyase
MVAARFITNAIWAVVLAGQLYAGIHHETGAYLVRNYGAKDYNAAPDNWAIAQDKNGVLYFGNTDGVLVFDGTSWRTIVLENKSFARSLAVDEHGTIYVGGVGDFGSLQPDAAGTLTFVSLLSKVPAQYRQFGDIWRTLATSKGVYFSCYSRLFRLNSDGSVKVWSPLTRFGRAFTIGDELYIKTPERGLLQMAGDDWTAVPGGMALAGMAVSGGIQTAEGALVATSNRFFRVQPSGLEPYATGADKYFEKNLIYSTQVLPGGLLGVGTSRGGLVLLNSRGEVERILTKEADGLADDYITAIYVDPQGAVWLAENNGITRFNPGLTRFGNGDGLQGDVQAVDRWADTIYLGTTAGVFRMRAEAGVRPKFQQVDGISSKVWCLLPWQGDLLVGTDLGVSVVSGQEARRVLESTVQRIVWDLSLSRRDPNLVYAAGRAGVFALRRSGEVWEQAASLSPLGEEFRSVVEDDDGRVWATTTQGSIWRIDFRRQPVAAEKFGVAQGVPLGSKTARRFQGHITFATEKGLKRYAENLKHFAPDLSLGKEFADGSRDVYNLFDDRDGNVWVTGRNYHGLRLRQGNGYRWYAAPLLRSGIREIYAMHPDDDGIVWALGDESILFRWEPALAGDPDRGFNVLTRRVQVAGAKDASARDTLFGGEGNPDSIRLPFRLNDLRFDFAAPFFEEPSAVEYQVLLEGSDKRWSSWSQEPHRDYTNLSEGSYRFRVRARSPHGAVSEQSTFTFGVLPPWYRTWWAYSVYLICAGFGVWGLVIWRTRQLQAEKRQLEVIVEERTVEIREQRDEIQVQERKSQALLLNILPASVAEELKATGAVEPVGFDDVTVCFTDFVGFTLSSEKLPPDILVNSLNGYFTAFDEIVARYGLEKLKTIGDSYMFVSGLPAQRKSHAADAVLAAMEMVEVVKALSRKPGGTAWGIRVGLHSGPVVAGVVGTRKFAFDIWGNTVNFAARMESSGVPGQVNMSERTCRLLHELVECEFRGNVKIKEGRELPMFLARRPAVADKGSFAQRYEQEFGETLKSFPETVFWGAEEGRLTAAASSGASKT